MPAVRADSSCTIQAVIVTARTRSVSLQRSVWEFFISGGESPLTIRAQSGNNRNCPYPLGIVTGFRMGVFHARNAG